MKKDLLHVFYIATSVFVSIFLVAIYASPARTMPPTRAQQVARTVTREIVTIEYKYVYFNVEKPSWSFSSDKK